ncbi:MAG: hypothetical protein AAFO82_18655, partial [Bacteroidota bacterium]
TFFFGLQANGNEGLGSFVWVLLIICIWIVFTLLFYNKFKNAIFNQEEPQPLLVQLAFGVIFFPGFLIHERVVSQRTVEAEERIKSAVIQKIKDNPEFVFPLLRRSFLGTSDEEIKSQILENKGFAEKINEKISHYILQYPKEILASLGGDEAKNQNLEEEIGNSTHKLNEALNQIRKLEQQYNQLRGQVFTPENKSNSGVINQDINEEFITTAIAKIVKKEFKKIELEQQYDDNQIEKIVERKISSYDTGQVEEDIKALIEENLRRTSGKIERKLKKIEEELTELKAELIEANQVKIIPKKEIKSSHIPPSQKRVNSDTKSIKQENTRNNKQIPAPKKVSIMPSKVSAVFYYPAPKDNGLFYSKHFSESHIKTETVYQIFVDGNSDNRNAVYSIVKDPKTREIAKNAPNDYLLPAMELKGKGDIKTAKHMEVIKEGSLVKDGNNWRIKEKGILYYE